MSGQEDDDPRTAPVVYRQVDGDWVAYGPSSLMCPGRRTIAVQLANGSTEERQVTRIEMAPLVNAYPYSYAYLEPRPGAGPKPTAVLRPADRGCVTGGNCSSFGEGESCGGEECDGW